MLCTWLIRYACWLCLMLHVTNCPYTATQDLTEPVAVIVEAQEEPKQQAAGSRARASKVQLRAAILWLAASVLHACDVGTDVVVVVLLWTSSQHSLNVWGIPALILLLLHLPLTALNTWAHLLGNWAAAWTAVLSTLPLTLASLCLVHLGQAGLEPVSSLLCRVLLGSAPLKPVYHQHHPNQHQLHHHQQGQRQPSPGTVVVAPNGSQPVEGCSNVPQGDSQSGTPAPAIHGAQAAHAGPEAFICLRCTAALRAEQALFLEVLLLQHRAVLLLFRMVRANH